MQVVARLGIAVTGSIGYKLEPEAQGQVCASCSALEQGPAIPFINHGQTVHLKFTPTTNFALALLVLGEKIDSVLPQ